MRPGLLVASLLLLLGCVGPPSDPVAFGELCVPSADDCPTVSTLSRDAVGRNQLDYSVENQGDTRATVRVVVRVPGDGESPIITEQSHVLEPGESEGNRWTPQVLGTRDSFELVVICSGCDVRVPFVLTSVPLECVRDDECSGGWLCDTNVAGRCVECIRDRDCDVDQRCDTRRGRCTPEQPGGCTTGSSSRPGLILSILLGLFLMASILGVRRRLNPLTVVAFLATSLLVLQDLDAAPPKSSLSFEAGAHGLTGNLGENSNLGIGFSIGQELRWKYAGISVRLGTSYFLTDQEEPPFSRGIQTYSAAIGPRGYIPLGPMEIAFGVDYVRMGLASNSLVRQSGLDTQHNALGMTLGARYRWSGLEARLTGGWTPIFGLDTSVVTLDLGFALTSGR